MRMISWTTTKNWFLLLAAVVAIAWVAVSINPARPQDLQVGQCVTSTLGDNAAYAAALGLDFTIYSGAEFESIRKELHKEGATINHLDDADTLATAIPADADDDDTGAFGLFADNCLLTGGAAPVDAIRHTLQLAIGRGAWLHI